MRKIIFGLCLIIESFFSIKALEQLSEHPFNISSEMLEKYPELIWIKELYLCAEIQSEMNQDEIDKAVIICNQCNMQLCCAHLGGILSSNKDRKNLDILKQLMTIGDGTKISSYMLLVCNQLEIACFHCHTFTGWHSNQENA